MDIQDRIKQIIDERFNSNVSAFCRFTGIKQPTMNTIIGERRSKPSYDVLLSIVDAKALNINSRWLLTGDGNMFENEKTSSDAPKEPKETLPLQGDDDTYIYNVPLLPMLSQGGVLNEFAGSASLHDCETVVSPIKGADFAIQVAGDSMYPEYPSGSRVLIKKVNEEVFLEWGKAYVLDTQNGVIIKIVVPSEREDCLRCISINKDPIYAPFDVPKSSIYGIYRVLMCMIMK